MCVAFNGNFPKSSFTIFYLRVFVYSYRVPKKSVEEIIYWGKKTIGWITFWMGYTSTSPAELKMREITWPSESYIMKVTDQNSYMQNYLLKTKKILQ